MLRKAPPKNQYDLAIAGGGLAGGLIALALNKLRPELDIALIEADDHFGGNHIWSFFESDIADEHRWLIEPMISGRWDSYDVRFPKYSRSLKTGYRSIRSDDFNKHIKATLPNNLLKNGQQIKSLHAGLVKLENGDEIAAAAALDVRGGGDVSSLEFGWQKFVGQMLKLKAPHGLERPIIMDATVEQIDGYRFVYCLPFGEDEIFVEDTYYSDTKDFDETALRSRIEEYAADNDWAIQEVLHEEQGQLPVIYGGDFDQFWDANAGVMARAGSRAALIQPITSYSLPTAVQTAMLIADMPDITQAALDKALTEFAYAHWDKSKFYRILCAMMFKAAEPEKRYLTLEHTYGKDEALIERFYAGKTTLRDQAALLTGRPPIPILKALPIIMQYR